ncbi:MAG: tRNA epoxyqueuosine(34) reductase QueG [Chlorobium sp.]
MADPSTDLTRTIRREAAKLGFSAIGFSAPVPQRLAMERFTDMIDEGRHGEMGYMEKRMEERSDPSLLLPGLKTIITAAISYNNPLVHRDGWPKISKYAITHDYHTVVRQKLEQLIEKVKTLVEEPFNAIVTVDSAPLLEKAWAEQAGIGKTGKNTLLIVPSAGSHVFLGEILLDMEIRDSAKPPLPNPCGSCSLCIEHCPTGALLGQGKLDAATCISYLTVELKREFKTEEAAMIGEWVFGCDLCQEICPHNRQALVRTNDSFALLERLMNISTEQILNLTRSGFRDLFYGTPVFRIGLRRLKRNARAVAENLKKTEES